MGKALNSLSLINAAQILSIARLSKCSPDRSAIPATSQTTESKFIKNASILPSSKELWLNAGRKTVLYRVPGMGEWRRGSMLFCSTLLTVVGGYDRMKVPFGESIGIYTRQQK